MNTKALVTVMTRAAAAESEAKAALVMGGGRYSPGSLREQARRCRDAARAARAAADDDALLDPSLADVRDAARAAAARADEWAARLARHADAGGF